MRSIAIKESVKKRRSLDSKVSANAVIEPAENTLGAVDLIIFVEEKAADRFAHIDDYYVQEFLGKDKICLSFWLNPLFNAHDRIEGRMVTPNNGRLKYHGLGYQSLMNSDGQKFGSVAGLSHVQSSKTSGVDTVNDVNKSTKRCKSGSWCCMQTDAAVCEYGRVRS